MTSADYILEIVPTNWAAMCDCPYKTQKLADGNAGYDVYCRSLTNVPNVAMANGKGTLIPLGLKARLLKDNEECHYWLLPRSSIYKTPLLMANSVGVIDKTYRGELMAPVRSIGPAFNVESGERYFQIVAPDMGRISEVRIVESLPETLRGTGGFGSTG